MFQVEFLKIQNQVNKIIWHGVQAKGFKCFSEDNFTIVTYWIVRNPVITTDRNVLLFLFLGKKGAN